MTSATYFAIYLGSVIFLVGSIRRILQYARMPVHLRWELYPVPHEERDRAAHGGSYFESTDWWTRPAHLNVRGEARAMAAEILFLKALREFNRKLWYPSYLFHFGLYSTIATGVLLISQTAIFLVSGWEAGGGLVRTTYRITGYAGFVATLAGAIALLWRRLRDPQLKNYTHPADVANLLFFAATYGVLGVGYLARPAGSAGITAIARGVLTFDLSVYIPPLFGCGLLLASLLVAYIPFTHMAHFIAKYFTYHAVRWDDRSTTRGGRMESTAAEYLSYKPIWAAPHVGATGEKTWAEIATANPAQEVRK
jgi:nitrate reductase gamma subunit